MNNINLIGRLTKDPELRMVGEYPKAEFSIAVERDYIDKNGDRIVDFIPIEVWGKQADTCIKYLHKGKQIAIEGQLNINRYKNSEGESKTFAKVKAKSFKFLGSVRTENKYFDSSAIFEENEDYEEISKEELPF